jgi:pimeloyl-ACP methyl ester carboxylesterase
VSGFARTWGEGPRAVLALHCSLAHSGAWDGVARALGPGLRVTAPDILGHGKAPDIDLARDLHDQCYEAVLSHLPEGRFDAVGHSFGATLALRLAEEMPERIRSLTLIEPVLFAAAKGSGTFGPYRQVIAEYDRLIASQSREAAAREFLRLWGAGGGLDDMPEGQRRYMIDRIHFIKASDAALFGDSAGLVPRLGQVTAPTLLVEGAERLPVTAAVIDRMARDIPDTVRVTVPGAGHMVPITHPGPVAAAIAALFTRTG